MIDSGTFEIDGEAGTWAAYVEDGEVVTYFSDGSHVRGYIPQR